MSDDPRFDALNAAVRTTLHLSRRLSTIPPRFFDERHKLIRRLIRRAGRGDPRHFEGDDDLLATLFYETFWDVDTVVGPAAFDRCGDVRRRPNPFLNGWRSRELVRRIATPLGVPEEQDWPPEPPPSIDHSRCANCGDKTQPSPCGESTCCVSCQPCWESGWTFNSSPNPLAGKRHGPPILPPEPYDLPDGLDWPPEPEPDEPSEPSDGLEGTCWCHDASVCPDDMGVALDG